MKTTIAIITAIQTTITIQKISSKSQSICGPKVDMSCGKYRCSSIEASPRKSQSANVQFVSPQNAFVYAAPAGPARESPPLHHQIWCDYTHPRGNYAHPCVN